MTILVTGATGQVGAAILDRLHGTDVRALTRDPARLGARDGVTAVQGDLTDPVSIEAALQGVDTLFLLTTVSPEETSQPMMAVNLAKAAGVRGIVYLSVSHADRYVDTPHYARMDHDLARMFAGFQREGMIPAPHAASTMEQLIGHPLRRYRDFAQEAVAS